MPLLFAFFLFLSPLWPFGDHPRVGDPMIIVNKQTNQLAFIRHGKIERIYRVATGKTNVLTPEGIFTVTVKAVNPYYRKKTFQEEHRTTRLVRDGSDLMHVERTVERTAFMERIDPNRLDVI